MEHNQNGIATLAKEDIVRDAQDDKKSPATDRKSTRLNSSHIQKSRMPSSA